MEKSFHLQKKEEIELYQKKRVNNAIALPKGMPSVMKFYAYENELNRQKVNQTVANDIALIWASFLNKESRQVILEGGLLLNEIPSYPTDIQVNVFKSYIANKVYSSLEKEEDCSFFLSKEKKWGLYAAILEAFQFADFSADQCQYYQDYFPFKFSTQVHHDKDGIGIGVCLRDTKPLNTFSFSEEKCFALDYSPSYEY